MGEYTYTDVVKYVAHNVAYGEVRRSIEDNSGLFAYPNSYFDNELNWKPYNNDDLIINGWKYENPENLNNLIKIGKRNKIYADKWTKDDYVVYLVNEDRYDNVGCFSIAVVGDKKEDIKKFCEDNNFPCKIEEDDTIQRTL